MAKKQKRLKKDGFLTKQDKNENNTKDSNSFIIYNGLVKEEIQSICEIFCVLQATILSMVRNAVFVLPNDKKNNIKSYNLPKKLSQLAKSGDIKVNDIQYDKPMTTKDILLCGIKDKQKKQLLEKIISKIAVLENGKKIRITLKKNAFQALNTLSQTNLKQDIAIIEQIINTINTQFIKLLPDAKRNAKKLMAQLENSRKKIPATARFEPEKNNSINQ